MSLAQSPKASILIGIDGGGTKTEGLLITGEGRVLAQASVGSLNVQRTRPATFASRLRMLFHKLFTQAGIAPNKVAVLCLGLAGAGREEDQTAAQKRVQALDLAEQVIVTSDGLVALEGAFAGGPGVIVSAGTGSIALGKNAEGRVARSGGWGYLLGDEGSAFDIARQAITASLMALDGRGSPTLLAERIKSQLGLQRLDQIVHKVYVERMRPDALARLAPLVFEAAQEGDRVAAELIEAAGHELGRLALAVCHQLNMMSDVRLCLIGGLSAHRSVLLPQMKTVLREISHLTVQSPRFSPVQGATLWALQSAGVRIDSSTLTRLEASFKAGRSSQDSL